MKSLISFGMLLCISIIYAQRKEQVVNLVFLDKTFPRKCPICEPITESQKREDQVIKEFIKNHTCLGCADRNFAEYLNKMELFADTSAALSGFGKAQVYYRLAYDLMRYESEMDNKVFNVSAHERINTSFAVDARNLDKVLAGAQQVKSYLDESSRLSDEQGKYFLKHVWLEYAYGSGFMDYVTNTAIEEATKLKYIEDEWLEFTEIDEIEAFVSTYEHLRSVNSASPLLTEVSQSYQKTGYNPQQEHPLITPSFNWLQSKNYRQFGVELALDIANLRNPYRVQGSRLSNEIYTRFSGIYVGMNQLEANSRRREFYFGIGRSTQIGFIYANIFQFGWKQGLDPDKFARWFYRPEAGFSFGNFQVFYSYTLLFSKQFRPMVDNHTINFRFTLPHVRIGRYY